MDELIPFQKALSIINGISALPHTEKVPIEESLLRILAENITTPTNVPEFDHSAMDGYACRASDSNQRLEVIEEIPAGKDPQKKITEGTCSRIMTGAKIPTGADKIIMQENVESAGSNHIVIRENSSRRHIRYAGEDLQKGEMLLPKGTVLRPWHMAMIASAGKKTVEVAKKPKVIIAATGSELMEPGKSKSDGQIFNSNSYQMLAQLRATGIDAEYGGILKDEMDAVKKFLKNSMDAELTLLSGGVSVGDYDFIPDALHEMGYTIHFHGVNVKPGKRTIFAEKSGKYVLGLPGKPVSSFVQFELMSKPLLYKLMNTQVQTNTLTLQAGEDFRLKPATRFTVIPVVIEQGRVFKINYHGSSHIHAYANARGMAMIPEGTDKIEKNDRIDVRLI
ncbi:MAG: molybdopterin molybdotransferase MoeA [Bacteroidales bacterium]|nr:molybdopterin molybdotransferase MoeA [Bacteroidales bacterium]MCF8333958.1 molybdopterin molybdotransferase MoeA [Bacteroidales bacterium]